MTISAHANTALGGAASLMSAMSDVPAVSTGSDVASARVWASRCVVFRGFGGKSTRQLLSPSGTGRLEGRTG